MAVCSCGTSVLDPLAGLEPGKARVCFQVEPAGTKAALASGAETRLETLDLLVFRTGTGLLDCHSRVLGTDRVQADVPAGESLDWYLVANLPSGRLDGIGTEEAFLAAQTYLSDTGSSMVMSASGMVTIPYSSRGEYVELGPFGLDRYACKISVTDITVEWLGDFASAPSCTVDRLIVMNGRTAGTLSGEATSDADAWWVNKLTDEALDSDPSSAVGKLAYDSPALAVTSAAKTALGSVVYAMPNASTSDENALDTPWAPRRTRLCVRLTIGGVQQWYPIDLPAMERNHHYVVSDLVIRGPGTAGPDQGVDRTDLSFNISVTPWGTDSQNILVEPQE